MKDTRGIVEGTERELLAKGFGKELRTVRNRQELSLEHLGRLAGVSKAHISCLERGHRRPSGHIIEVLVSVLAPDSERQALCERLAGLAGESLRQVKPRKKRREDAIARHRARIEYATEVAEKQQTVRRIEATGGLTFPEQRRMTRTELTERLAKHVRAKPASERSRGRKTPAQQRLDMLTGLEELSLLEVARRLDKMEASDFR